MAESKRTDFLVETRGLVKEYRRRRVVNGVAMNVREGEIVGLLGPNGAGKTTSFYMITGLIRPTSGHVYFKGQDVTRLPMYRRARMGLGYLAQEPSIFRNLTVEENVLAILETLPIGIRERRRRLDYLLEELKIGYLAKQKAYTLSGGERRRLEITRALVTDPSLILLDEPELGLHPFAITILSEMIEAAARRSQVILATQSVTLLNQFAPEAIIIADNDGLRTHFRRLTEQDLSSWMNDYSVGDLWEKNIIGGRP